ncbi:Thiamine pathway transporter [Sphaerulina musiva]
MFSLALTPTPLGTGFPLQLDRFNLDDDHDNNMTTTHTEKVEHLSRVDTVVIGDGRKRSVDEAFEYLRNHADNSGAEAINLRQLRRKIDYRIIPLQFFICGLQFLDKFLLNYAIIMGLPEDLKLQGNQLNNIASSLWWAYLITTPFIGLLLNKLPLGKFLGGNMFLWGIVIACTAAVKNYPQLIAVRILMGITDAGMPPSLMLMSSQYYRKDEQAMRFAIWFSSVGCAMIAGGLISFGFQFVDSDVMASWRIMYLVLGLLSWIVGVLSFWKLPDSPMTATFLNDAEKVALIHHVSVNQTGITSKKFQPNQLRDLFLDPQVYLIFFLTLLVSTGSGILTVYATTIIKGFGFTSKEAALLHMPSGLIAIITAFLGAYAVRYHYLTRWTISILGYSASLLGASLVAFAPHSNRAAQLAGVYLVYFSLFTVGIKFQWTAANVAGHTKRTLATAMMSGAFAIGNICAPYAVQRKDAPRFQTGKNVLMATKAGAIGILCVLGTYYVWMNRRRDAKYGKVVKPVEEGSMTSVVGEEEGGSLGDVVTNTNSTSTSTGEREEVWENLTDRERKSFRYVY